MQKGDRYSSSYSSNVQNPVIKPQNEKKAWAIFIVVVLVLLALAIGVIVIAGHGLFKVFNRDTVNNPVNNSPRVTQQAGPAVSPTPFPFQELTIPALRAREYKSQLGERTLAYQNPSYTAYLANYDSDGLRVNGLLTEPTGEKPSGGWPAIVFVHGYIPPTQYTTQGQYYDYVDYLARNSFVVFKIDLRGHAQSEGDPGGSYYSSDYIIDTLNARAALMASDFVNPQKVGLWGHSMAGNVTLRSLAVQPDIPAVVIWGGAVFTYADRLEYGIQDGSYMPPAQTTERQRQRQRLRDLYGEFNNNHPFWKQVAPTNYLNDIKGAVSLHSAINDDVVNIGYSRGLNALLDKTKIPHKLNEYPSGGHNISGTSFVSAMQDTVMFFKEYLK